jgi:uncharacterized protein (TIGR02466 family)
MSVFSLFSVPFDRTEMPDSKALNIELRDLFLRREAEGARWQNPRSSMSIPNGLFESNFSLFSSPEPCIQKLHEFCMLKLFNTVGEANGYSIERLRQLESRAHAWFHITRRGGRFSAHSHPMASWSGVYCVSAGESDANEPLSGVLHFQNPHQHAGMYTDPANKNLIDAYTLKGRNLTLRAGELVLFPSWLFHEVYPFQGEGERITVAFNCWFLETDGVSQ